MKHYQPTYRYQSLKLDDLISRIDNKIPFAYAKINHGFWERMLESPDPTKKYSASKAKIIDKEIDANFMFECGFIYEFYSLLKAMPTNDSNFIFAISPHGWKNGDIIEGTPKHPQKLHKLIHDSIPKDMPYSDGLNTKNWILDQSIIKLFECFRNNHLLIVGPGESYKFAEFIEHDNYDYISINETDARKDRRKIEKEIINKIESSRSQYNIIIFQAGVLSSCLILYLYKKFPNTALIDLGLVIDIYDPELVLKRNWGKAYRKEVVNFYENFKPNLSISRISKTKSFNLIAHTPKEEDNLIKFIENKPVDQSAVENLLQLSKDKNHWANEGPVSKKLETAIHSHFKLSELQSVIMCANCTIGLDILAKLVEIIIERKPKIIVSSYGFFSTKLGAYQDSAIIDCDTEGFLDYSLLKTKIYDAFVYTNIFGLKTDISDALSISKSQKKYLIVDNAAGFNSLDRRMYNDKIFEAISFHHTKPFGFGEGGCVIVPKKYESVVRALLNFGTGKIDQDSIPNTKTSFIKSIFNFNKNNNIIYNHATNGKISDISCAYIYQHLRLMDEWGFYYSSQARRISHIAENAGLKALVKNTDFKKTMPGQLPFLSSKKLNLKDLNNNIIQLRKYYIPHDNSKNANYIYDHIINIPTHKDISQASDNDLYDLFKRLS